MNNSINQFIDHKLVLPQNYHRRYDHDLPTTESTLKRAALIALPFASLYAPFGSALSLSMGALRSITNLTESAQSFLQGDYKQTAAKAAQTALAVLALGSSIVSFKLGLVVTTASDFCLSLSKIPDSPDEAAAALISAAYLGILFTGSLEVIFLFAYLQIGLSVGQAMMELDKERYPEAMAKIAMAMIRGKQAYGHFQNILERNAILSSMEFFKDLGARSEKGKNAVHLLNSPLKPFAHPVILSDASDNEYDFGSYSHGFGKTLVKEMNLGGRSKVIDGKEVLELDFKINHVHRTKLQNFIDQTNKADPAKMRRLLELKHSHIKNITCESTYFPVGTTDVGSAYKFNLEGFGTLFVGKSANCYTLYDRILLRFDPNASMFLWHEALSLFDLDDALRLSVQDEIERLKIGHLFRVLFPKEATPFERTQEYFDLPIDNLKQKICQLAPGMQEGFSTYLDKMELKELYPGKMRYAIPGLGQRAYDLGARGLIASITGAYRNDQLFERIASMLKMGMICSEDRLSSSLGVKGLSSGTDFYTGGADSVFTQMVIKWQTDQHTPLDNFAYFHSAALVFSPELLDMGTYQYHYDSYGKRGGPYDRWYGIGSYFDRPSIFDFVKQKQSGGRPWFDSNEVMIKERILPSSIRSVVLSDPTQRNDLLEYLRKKNLVVGETILGIPVEKFLRVADHVSEDLFTA